MMLIRQLVAVCLAGLAAAVTDGDASSDPLSICNKANVALVEFKSQTQPGLCESWLNSERRLTVVRGLTSEELTAACGCISDASMKMKLALQSPVVRVVKSTPKPAPKPVVKTTAKTTPPVVKTTPKVSLKIPSVSSSKRASSVVSSKATSVSAKKSSSSVKSGAQLSSSVTSSSVRYCGLYPCSKLTLKPWPKSSAKGISYASVASSRPCIGIACSKLTAKASATVSPKTGISIKSSTQLSTVRSKSSGVGSKSVGSTSSASPASRSGTKVLISSKSGTRLSSSVTGTVKKGISSKKSSSSTGKVKPTSGPSSGDESGSASGGDDSGSGDSGGDGSTGSDSGDAGSSDTTTAGSDDSATTTNEPAATSSMSDDGSATSDDGSSPTSASSDAGDPSLSTSTLPASTLTSTKARSNSLVKSSTISRSILTKSDASIPNVTQPTSSAAAPTSSPTSTSSELPVVKSKPICKSPLNSNETFQLYISGTNSAIDNTPMQGLPNGATAVGFSVGYVTLNFTLDCSTGYVHWGDGSVLSGNTQAFSVKSQSVVVAPLGDSNNSPLSCSLDSNFALSCQYTSSRSPNAFQSWAVSTGDARYLAMSQSNTTGITLKAVPLKSNSAIVYPTHSTNQRLIANGDFAASSVTPWSKFTQGKSSDVGFTTPAVNASQSCYAFAGMLSITSSNNFVNGYAWSGISQPGLTLYMGEQLFLGYDVLLNYPLGLPSGVRCDIQVKGTEHDTLSYVRYDSSSPAFVSFNTTTTASYNGTGSFSITAYCQGRPGGPWPALNLGFNNVRLLAAYDPTDVGAALTCGFRGARDTIESATLQPYCSSLLSYTTPTTTLTEVISTTTTSTMTVNFAKRKRDIVTAAPEAVIRSLRPRQLDSPANITTTASDMSGGSSNALATFAPQDVTNACSVEAVPVSTTITETTSTTTTITAYATQTKLPNLFVLSSSANRGLYVGRDGSGAVSFTGDINAAHVFYIDSNGVPRSWQDPSMTLVDHYEPNSGTADNRIYIEAPSSASYTVTCNNRGRNAGDYFGSCQSSGPPNGNPVVYGFGWCPNTQALYMIPNSSNVRCNGGYAFLGFFLVAAP